jgi:Protein of unknown function (DUF3224)
MPTRLTSTFEIRGWDEQPFAEAQEGARLTRASVEQGLSGDIEGEGAVQWLMCYRPDKTADFVGLQRIAGSVGGRQGSLALLQTDGTFDGREARGRLSVVPGSGTGELEGVRGEGEFSALHGGAASLTLELELDLD